MRTRFSSTLLAALALAVAASGPPASAQSLEGRPLRALSAEVLGSGHHALEVGVDASWGIRPEPILGSTRGDLVQAPVVRYRLGLGRGEFAVGMPLYQWLSPDDGRDGTDDFGDATFFVTIQAIRQRARRPSFAAHFGTKLPNASDPTFLGTDEPDIYAGFILSHAGPAHDLRFNAGIGLIGDPLDNTAQEDVLTYALAGRQGKKHAVLWEIFGQTSGGDPARDLGEDTVRLGYARLGGRTIIDVSMLGGLHENSCDVGLSAGATFLFGDGR